MPELLQSRVSPDEYLQIAAIAAAADMTVSEMTRVSLFERLPEWRKLAEETQRRRAQLPHGVTDKMVLEATEQLIVELNRTGELHLPMRDLFSPRSKAVLRLLEFIWSDNHSDASRKAMDRLAERVQEAIERAGKTKPPTTDGLPADVPTESKTRSRGRRSNK